MHVQTAETAYYLSLYSGKCNIGVQCISNLLAANAFCMQPQHSTKSYSKNPKNQRKKNNFYLQLPHSTKSNLKSKERKERKIHFICSCRIPASCLGSERLLKEIGRAYSPPISHLENAKLQEIRKIQKCRRKTETQPWSLCARQQSCLLQYYSNIAPI